MSLLCLVCRGLQEAIDRAGTDASVEQAVHEATFNSARMKLLEQLKRHERSHYRRGDHFTGRSMIIGDPT